MRSLVLVLAAGALAPAALADSRLKGGDCSGPAEASAIARLGDASQSAGRAQILRSTCNGKTRTFHIRQTASGANTMLRVTEFTGRPGSSVIRAETGRGFSSSSSAKLVRVPRD